MLKAYHHRETACVGVTTSVVQGNVVPFIHLLGHDVCQQSKSDTVLLTASQEHSTRSAVPVLQSKGLPVVEPTMSVAMVAVIPDSDNNDGVGLEIPTLCPRTQEKEAYRDVHYDEKLSESQAREIQTVFSDVTEMLTADPGSYKGSEMCEVRLTTDIPIRLKQYPLPFSSKEVIVKEVQSMLDLGVIEASTSPYSSPIVLVTKPDGSVRFCQDFRALNRVTVFDAEPIPDMEELFTRLSDKQYLTKIDLSKGYWQLLLKPEDRPKTAFQTPIGLFQWVRMPFGLVSAPAAFARMMRAVLAESAINFFDDILVASCSWEAHLKDVRAVLTKLQEAGLTAKPSKIYAGFQKLEFLGHMVGRGGLQPVEKKVQKILSITTPKTKRRVRALLGLVGYYRRYVPNFASLTAPISDLLAGKPRRQILWSEACAEALRKIQNILSSFPVLLLPDLSLPFVVRTDASSSGLGGVLMQERDDDLHPICFVSRKMLDREKRYSTIERECLAIVWVLCKLQRYLWGRSFLIQTDHRPLAYLRSGKFQNARIMRWALALQEFTFEVESIPGTQNMFADVLSRSECDQEVRS